jgi:putative methionine-R-sulfoxide reductase with GAF domain
VDETERSIIEVFERAAERLSSVLDDAEIGCLYRYGDTLRHVAHAGRLRLIYEVPREQGGVVWRAVERGEVQLVEDVRADPDYLASDESVRAEVAAPVVVDETVVGVVDVEFPGRVYEQVEVEAVKSEARRLGAELAPLR